LGIAMLGPLFPTRWKNDKPPSIEEFIRRLRAEYLFAKRWPDGFECPRCGSKKGWRLESRPWLFECAGKGAVPGCRRQTSLIAGTVMQHASAAQEVVPGRLSDGDTLELSALQLQPKLDVSYKTAWLLLHKLRRAMVDPDRTRLTGKVEVDESAIPYRRKQDTAKRGGGSSTANKIWIAGAVETIGRFGVGRIRLARIADRSAGSLVPFVVDNTQPGTTVRTDGLEVTERCLTDAWNR
jgi:hypothetical protein